MPPQLDMRQEEAAVRERPAPAVHASPAAPRPLRTTMIVAMVAAVFLALSGAFNTGLFGLPVRLGFWVLAMGIGSGLGSALVELMRRRGWLERGPAVVIAIVSLAMTLPLTVVVWALSGLIMGQGFGVQNLPQFALPTLIITALVTSVNVFIEMGRPHVTHAEVVAPGDLPKPVRFLERIPRKLRAGRLIALQAEDHYLRIHTNAGSDLILMRLSDAVAELDGIEGAQTHRSWWVAKDAVEGVETGDGRATLTLPGGVQAPVSRTYAKSLREAGWF